MEMDRDTTNNFSASVEAENRLISAQQIHEAEIIFQRHLR